MTPTPTHHEAAADAAAFVLPEGELSVIAKYRQVPVIVEAMKLSGNAEQVLSWIIECGQPSGGSGVSWELDDFGPIYILTPAGIMAARQGDYVIRGSDGQFFPCPRETFVTTYEEAA
jgi:hypothetical protein